MLLLLLLLPALTPLVSPHPPFQDWAGHLAVAGALLHLGEPGAGTDHFLIHQRTLGPNGALYPVIAALARILPPTWAAGLVLAAVLGSIGPASLRLCRAAGADPRLALLSLPVAFARPTYAGFIPNVAATSLLVVVLAAYLDHRRTALHRHVVLQVVLQSLLALTHAFVALVSIGLIGLWAALDLAKARRTALWGAAAAAAGLLVLGVLFAGGGALGGAAAAIVSGDRAGMASDLWSWLVGFRGGTLADDLLQIAWLAPLAALIGAKSNWDAPARHLLFALLAVAVAFVLIPMDVGPPVSWWGARGRLPAVAVLLAIPLVPAERPRALWLAVTAAVAITIYSLVELWVWERTIMPGFDAVLAALPEGRALSVLWYDVDPNRRFPGAPLGHAGGWYVLEKGGATAQTFFEPAGAGTVAAAALPFAVRRPVPGPPWGMAELFDPAAHTEGVDLYLVRGRPDAPGAPFYGASRNAITKLAEHGAWSAWTTHASR